MESREFYIFEMGGKLIWYPIFYTKRGAKSSITWHKKHMRRYNVKPLDFKIVKVSATVEREDESA